MSGPVYTFSSGEIASPDEVNTNFANIYANALNRTDGTMSGPLNTQHVLPNTANTYDIGSASFPFRNGFWRSSLVLASTTANYTVTWADPSGARALTVPDPGGTDSFAYLAATQTLTNKTLTAPVLSGTLTGTYVLGGSGSLSSGLMGSITQTGTVTTGTWSASFGAVSGAALTSLTAANVTGSHTLPDGVLSTNVPLLNAGPGSTTTFCCTQLQWNGGAVLSSSSVVVATTGTYSDPSWITSLAASKLTGTVATANGGLAGNFSATAQGNTLYFSAAGVVSALGPGTAGMFLRTGGAAANPTWSNDGSNLTSLNASNISSGSLGNARLSGTYANALTLSSGSNAFTGSYAAADGSLGVTASCTGTPTGAWLTVKNGLITALSC